MVCDFGGDDVHTHTQKRELLSPLPRGRERCVCMSRGMHVNDKRHIKDR